MKYTDSITSKLLIINCLSGGGGHRLGRLLSCCDGVYWYASPHNGMHPWDFAHDTWIKEACFSKYHYDRIMPDGSSLPLLGNRIEKYWDTEQWIDNWYQIMSELDLPDGYLTFVVHDSPSYLRRLFPSSVIVNLISDPLQATKHHMATSANFRIDYAMKNQIPDYESEWVKHKNALLQVKPQSTEIDLWCHRYDRTPKEYERFMLEQNMRSNERNEAEANHADITVTWKCLDLPKLWEIFGTMHDDHTILLQACDERST